jgi:AcrR family transcriptional regulator
MAGAPRRADAQRNRQLLLDAAREVFDEQGTGAPLDEIARRAGVGNATMYRHFANRRELALAVYAGEVERLCDRGAALLDDPFPERGLYAWLLAFVEHVSTRSDLVTAVLPQPGAAEQGGERFEQWHAAMRRTVAALVDRAKAAGAVRADLDAADLLTLAVGVARTGIAGHGVRADQAERLLDIVRRGTRGAAGQPLEGRSRGAG